MKKMLSILGVCLLLAPVALPARAGGAGGGSHASSGGRSSSVRSSSGSSSSSRSQSASSNRGFSSRSTTNTTVINNHTYNIQSRSYGYGGYHYSGDYVSGMMTGALLASAWNHPTNIIVLGDQRYIHQGTGYINTSGDYYETLPVAERDFDGTPLLWFFGIVAGLLGIWGIFALVGWLLERRRY